jgi:polysaccharide deacetylase 2 family uncharacterized protein YibQ
MNCVDKISIDNAHNSGDNCALDLPMFPASHLHNMSDTLAEMASSDTFVLAVKVGVKFISSDSLLAPF